MKNTITYTPCKQGTNRLLVPAVALTALLCTVLPARAYSPPVALLSARAADGLFPKIRYPKINVGKGAKALLYPVTKTTVNSGKTVVNGGRAALNGGVVAVKGAQKGLEIYEAGRALSSKVSGVPGLSRLK